MALEKCEEAHWKMFISRDGSKGNFRALNVKKYFEIFMTP